MKTSLIVLLFSVAVLLVAVTTMLHAVADAKNNDKLLTVTAVVFALSLCSTIVSILFLIGGAIVYS